MKIVVAGADGYIGSRVCRRFARMPGIDLCPLSRSSSKTGPLGSVDLVKSPDALSSALHDLKPDAVVNCVGTISTDLRACVESHVVATTNLLVAMAEAARGARLVQLGSAAEYGQAVPAPLLINEDTPPAPQGAYGVSKLASTLLAATHGPALGIECVVLRIFNVIGSCMAPGTIVPKVLGFLANPKRRPQDPIELGRLDGYRDYVHVDDVVSAIVAAVRVQAIASGTIINIASGEPVMVRMLVRRLLDAAGHEGEIREVASGSNRSTAVSWQHADISRAHQLLGWMPEKNLSDSIFELVRSNDQREKK